MISRFSEKIGFLELTCGVADGAVVELRFGLAAPAGESDRRSAELWDRVRAQLWEYVDGRRREFDLPVRYGGTAFQHRVWDELRRIGYGQTRTYGQIAAAVGCPGGSRAVGGACHSNPICVIVPCHRVVGTNGALTGFGGGVDIKQKLLRLEGVSARPPRLG